MAIDISQVQSNVQILQNLVLVTPGQAGYKPIQSIIDGQMVKSNDPVFVFDYEGEQKQSLSLDITDHPTEDNSYLNDHAALRPEKFQTQGYIGELNDIIPSVLSPLQAIAAKLVIVSALTPALSVAALVALNRAVSLYNTAAKAINTAKNSFGSLVNGTTPLNKQQTAYKMFKSYAKQRTLFTVQTPWSVGSEILQNMMIESITAIQDGDTDSFSTFEITFKQLQFATTIRLTNAQFKKARKQQERAGTQSEPQVNLGTNPANPTTKTPTASVKGITG